MGWWGCGPMQGDKPMDYQSDIEVKLVGELRYRELMELDDLDVGFGTLHGEVGVALQKMSPEQITDLIVWARRHEEIAVQVLAVILMEHGVKLSPEHRQILREAAAMDEWASNSEERKAEMDKLIVLIDTYKDVPTEFESKGLFDTIEDMMVSGKPGLVNK